MRRRHLAAGLPDQHGQRSPAGAGARDTPGEKSSMTRSAAGRSRPPTCTRKGPRPPGTGSSSGVASFGVASSPRLFKLGNCLSSGRTPAPRRSPAGVKTGPDRRSQRSDSNQGPGHNPRHSAWSGVPGAMASRVAASNAAHAAAGLVIRRVRRFQVYTRPDSALLGYVGLRTCHS